MAILIPVVGGYEVKLEQLPPIFFGSRAAAIAMIARMAPWIGF